MYIRFTNHKISFLLVLISSAGVTASLRAMDKKAFEMHPLMVPAVSESFIRGDKAVNDLRTYFNDDANLQGIASNGNPYHVNKNCALGLLDILDQNSERSAELLKKAAEGKSAWGNYYYGLMHLGGFTVKNDLNKAFEHFKQAQEYGKEQIPAPRKHVMEMLGLGLSAKFNAVTFFDRMLLAGKDKGDLMYPLSILARYDEDEDLQETCLVEALKYKNAFLPNAQNNYGILKFNRGETDAALNYFDDAILGGSEKAKSNKEIAEQIIKNDLSPRRKKDNILLPDSDDEDSDDESTESGSQSIDHSSIANVDKASMTDQWLLSSSDASNNNNQSPVIISSVKVVDVTSSNSPALASVSVDVASPSTPIVTVDDLRKKDEDSKNKVEKLRQMRESNKSQYVQHLLKEVTEGNKYAQCELAVYYLDNSENQKSRIPRGWDMLKQAVDQDHAGACMEYIVRGLAVNDVKNAEIAAYADTLFKDDLRMKRIQLTDEEKGKIYVARGMYALRTNDRKNARESLQSASDCGNDVHAYQLGVLYMDDNNFQAAQSQFAKVGEGKKAQAEWNKSVLEYVTKKDVGQKQRLLNAIVKPFIEEKTTLLYNDMKAILSLDRVYNALLKDADGVDETAINPQAAYLLATCARQGWGCLDVKASQEKPLEYYKKAVNVADEVFKKYCLERIQVLADEGSVAARQYLREKHPSAAEQRIDTVYALAQEKKWSAIEDHVQSFDEAELALLRKDLTQGNNVANSILGIKCCTEYQKKNDVKHLRSAIKCFRDAKNAGVEISDYLMRALYALADKETKNSNEREKLLQESADLGYDQACYNMYCWLKNRAILEQELGNTEKADEYTKKASHYLGKAGNYFLAQFATLASDLMKLNKESWTSLEARVDALIKRVESEKLDTNDIFKKDIGDLYVIKAGLCNGIRDGIWADNQEALEWLRKAAGQGEYTGAMVLALNALEKGNYADAKSLLDKGRDRCANQPEYVIMDLFTQYKLSQNNQQEYQAFKKQYQAYLTEWLLGGFKPDGIYKYFSDEMQGLIKQDAKASTIVSLLEYAGAVEAARGGIFLASLSQFNQGNMSVAPILIDYYKKNNKAMKAFETCVAYVASEDPSAHSHAAVALLNSMMSKDLEAMLKQGIVSGPMFNVNDLTEQSLKKILSRYNIAGKMLHNDERNLLIATVYSLSLRYFDTKQVDALFELVNNSPLITDDENQDIIVMRCMALLSEHNKFNWKTSDAAGKKAVYWWNKAAGKGDPVAEHRMMTLMATEEVLPCGINIQENMTLATTMACKVINNSQATQEQRLGAYKVMFRGGCRLILDKKTAPADRETYYEDVKGYHASLKSLRSYDHLPLYIQICEAMNNSEELSNARKMLQVAQPLNIIVNGTSCSAKSIKERAERIVQTYEAIAALPNQSARAVECQKITKEAEGITQLLEKAMKENTYEHYGFVTEKDARLILEKLMNGLMQSILCDEGESSNNAHNESNSNNQQTARVAKVNLENDAAYLKKVVIEARALVNCYKKELQASNYANLASYVKKLHALNPDEGKAAYNQYSKIKELWEKDENLLYALSFVNTMLQIDPALTKNLVTKVLTAMDNHIDKILEHGKYFTIQIQWINILNDVKTIKPAECKKYGFENEKEYKAMREKMCAMEIQLSNRLKVVRQQY